MRGMKSADEFDLIVLGAGLAGVCSALQAASAGAHVLLIEKQERIGGSSVMSGGCLAFAGTDIQRSHGVEDSSDLLFEDLREVGKLENVEAVVRAYTDHQLETYEWLKANGVEFSDALETASGQSAPRVHNVDPADMVRRLASLCENSGKVTLLRSARAERLLRSSGDARVNGVLISHDGTSREFRATRGVVLTTGGFCRNRELVHRFAPQYDEAFFIGGDGNVGDGLRMAWALGADFRDMAYIKGTFGKHPVDETNHHSCLAVYKGAIAVNQDGKRFVDESLSYKLLGDAVMAQPYHTGYQILDQDIFEGGDNRVRILDFERRLEEGLMIQADSLEKLAQLIEVPSAVLLATIERYNQSVAAGKDEEFGREHLVHKYGTLRRIERPPFYAYPSTAVVFGTYCGLTVDAHMRVLDVFGEPIPGLFAAGEVVGGLHGAAYMTGSALGKAAIFGRIAARTAITA